MTHKKKGAKLNREKGSRAIQKTHAPWTALSGSEHRGCITGKPRLRDETPALDGDREVDFAAEDDAVLPLDEVFR